MQFEGLISRVYMFFGTRSQNVRSVLKAEVELMEFRRMHSDKLTKNGEKCPKNAVLRRKFSRLKCFFDTGNPKSWSTLKPEVGLELTVFRRIISNKITKTGEK